MTTIPGQNADETDSIDSALTSVLNALPGLVWTANPDGRVDFLNQGWCGYTGLSVNEASDRGWEAAIHPDDLPAVLERWQAILASGEPREMEARLRRFDGEYRWFVFRINPLVDTSGQILKWCGLNTDVDQRRRTEEALNAAEHRFSLIVDGLPTLVSLRTPTGDLEFANRHVLEYVGATLDELKALSTTGPVHPDDQAGLLAAWDKALQTGLPYEIEARRLRADGVYRWFHVRGYPLRDEDGRVVTWYLLGIDIDDRKRAEEGLRRAQAELAHVSRMTTLGELAASIAHEVNQPLGSVVNNANACLSLLPKDAPQFAEIREALTEIIEGADRASGVVARVRQLSRKVPYERILVNLKDVVTEVSALARHEAITRQVTIRANLNDDLPSVWGDRLQLQQVLLNLVVNGMDAMNGIEASNRVLTISGRSEMRDGEPACLVSVQDAGTGFKPEELSRLFEAFYTTKSEGMGMGLAISRSIIEAHSGKLWAEANQGTGAALFFSLPDAQNAKS